MGTVTFGGAATPITFDLVPTVTGSYTLTGATAVLSGGIFDGWKINKLAPADTFVSAANESSSLGYVEFVCAATNAKTPGGNNDYMSGGMWLGKDIGVGDFDFTAKVSTQGSQNVNTAAHVGVGRVGGPTSSTDSPVEVCRRVGTTNQARMAVGAMGSTSSPSLFATNTSTAFSTPIWIRFTRVGVTTRCYWKVNDGDAWSEITSSSTTYDFVGAPCLMLFGFTFGFNTAANSIRVHRIVGSYYAP